MLSPIGRTVVYILLYDVLAIWYIPSARHVYLTFCVIIYYSRTCSLHTMCSNKDFFKGLLSDNVLNKSFPGRGGD